MSGRPPLRLLPAPEDRDPEPGSGPRAEPRGLPPRASGAAPLEIARALRVGEVVVWWGRKQQIDRRPIRWALALGVFMLGLATLLAPELWTVPIAELWKPLVPALAPAALLYARERLSLRTVLVTDGSVLVLDHRGRVERLAFRNVRRVGRDLLTGGILLEGAAHKLRLPPGLAEDAREAIASQTRHGIAGSERPIDPLGWLP